MILLQLSAAQGPEECALAVAKALLRLQAEADAQAVAVRILEEEPGPRRGTLRSVLLALDGEQAERLADHWTGSLQWTCSSPYRPGHARKNWFFGGARFAPPAPELASEIHFETLRSSGPGGSMSTPPTRQCAPRTWPAASASRYRASVASTRTNAWRCCSSVNAWRNRQSRSTANCARSGGCSITASSVAIHVGCFVASASSRLTSRLCANSRRAKVRPGGVGDAGPTKTDEERTRLALGFTSCK